VALTGLILLLIDADDAVVGAVFVDGAFGGVGIVKPIAIDDEFVLVLAGVELHAGPVGAFEFSEAMGVGVPVVKGAGEVNILREGLLVPNEGDFAIFIVFYSHNYNLP